MASKGAGSNGNGSGNGAARRARGAIATQALPVDQEVAGREAPFRAMLDYAADVVLVRDAEGHARYISPSVQDVLGYTPEALAGLTLIEFVHPDDQARVMEAGVELLDQPGNWADLQYRVR